MPTKPASPAPPVSIKVPADVGDTLRRESARRRGLSPRPPVWAIGEIVAELVRANLPPPKPTRRAPKRP